MKPRLCTCAEPQPYPVVAADGTTAALCCAVCNSPMPDRRQWPQGLLEAALQADLDRVLVPTDAVTTVVTGAEVGYEIRVDVIAAMLREALEANALTDGGEQDERALKQSA